ncbi:hypothetical protein [Cytobacillus kochii]|uniref:hypothetical protein n=1 Tax=Cytobacillus kochii TaxID=859143 RepID=UPI0020400BEF|nr:hypothetical protein [Cytobacillus kochii]MCM3324785.1 hypothetical protein [Cytobacillus kochii]MCM3347178.1 hypothetical protein [Cytobacillus kochii]
MAKNLIEVAMYKGDEFLSTGTIQEIAKQRKVRPETIRYYLTPAYANKLAKRKLSWNPIHVIRLDDEEE